MSAPAAVTPPARRSLLLGAFALGFGLLIAVALASAWLVQQQAEDNADVRRVLELQSRYTRALSILQDAETGQRGFLLTGDERYLQPYQGAAAAFASEFDNISKLIIRKERLQSFDRIRQLAAMKFAELDRTIALQRQGDRDGALIIVNSGEGKAAMDEVRSLISQAIAFDDSVLRERLVRANSNARLAQVAIFAAIALVLALAIFSLSAMRRQIQALLSEAAHRERAENQMRQMQKMEAVGQLTGGIAHDFNNMLAVIIGSISLMQKRLSRGETDIQRYADAAMEGAQRAAQLTSRLLAFSRQQPLMPSILDLNKVVAGMSDLVRRTIGETIQMETVLAGGLWRAHVDPGEIENAILNLCVNARDAMPDGGKLTIETANCYLDDNYAADNTGIPAGQYVLIAVTDTGSGMTKDVADRAFDPFFTTKPTGKGTGLGLSQVYGFVRQSGGHVKIYSEIDQGTSIKIYLPRTLRAEESVQPASPKPPAPTGDAREIILVVEDEDRVRLISVAALRELGYTVIHAESGDKALALLDEYPDVTMLFTDIVMPGMNGRTLATKAVEQRPSLKVLFTTGYTQNAVVHNGVVDADAQLLIKPYTIDQLAIKIREVLRAEARN
jgi:signal transduction histidine kinase/CheY-like chemotaxis protein